MFDLERGVAGSLWPYIYLGDLKPNAARVELQRLRSKGLVDFDTLIRPSLETAGILADFAPSSLNPVLKHVSTLVRLVPTPDWYWQKTGINRAALSPGNDIWFSESSMPVVFAASVYFGETLVRSYPFLRWDLGLAKQGTKNLPSIMGFKWAYPEPLVIVGISIFCSAHEGTTKRLETAMKSWVDQAEDILREKSASH